MAPSPSEPPSEFDSDHIKQFQMRRILVEQFGLTFYHETRRMPAGILVAETETSIEEAGPGDPGPHLGCEPEQNLRLITNTKTHFLKGKQLSQERGKRRLPLFPIDLLRVSNDLVIAGPRPGAHGPSSGNRHRPAVACEGGALRSLSAIPRPCRRSDSHAPDVPFAVVSFV
jgi:hypothetical protein